MNKIILLIVGLYITSVKETRGNSQKIYVYLHRTSGSMKT